MQEGIHKLRESLSRAPAGVQQCVTEAIGADRLGAILSGDTMPDSGIGEKMRGCFDAFLSAKAAERERGTDDQRDAGLPFGKPEGAREGQDSGPASIRPMDGSDEGARGIPPRVRECLIEKFGSDAVQKMERQGGPAEGEFGQAVAECSRRINSEFQGVRRNGDDSRPAIVAPPVPEREMQVQLRDRANILPQERQERFDENSLRPEVPLGASPFPRPEDSPPAPPAE